MPRDLADPHFIGSRGTPQASGNLYRFRLVPSRAEIFRNPEARIVILAFQLLLSEQANSCASIVLYILHHLADPVISGYGLFGQSSPTVALRLWRIHPA